MCVCLCHSLLFITENDHVRFKSCLEHFPIYLINEANFFCSPRSSQFLYVHSTQAVSCVPRTLSPFLLCFTQKLLITVYHRLLLIVSVPLHTFHVFLTVLPLFSLSDMQRITPPPLPTHTHTHSVDSGVTMSSQCQWGCNDVTVLFWVSHLPVSFSERE